MRGDWTPRRQLTMLQLEEMVLPCLEAELPSYSACSRQASLLDTEDMQSNLSIRKWMVKLSMKNLPGLKQSGILLRRKIVSGEMKADIQC